MQRTECRSADPGSVWCSKWCYTSFRFISLHMYMIEIHCQKAVYWSSDHRQHQCVQLTTRIKVKNQTCSLSAHRIIIYLNVNGGGCLIGQTGLCEEGYYVLKVDFDASLSISKLTKSLKMHVQCLETSVPWSRIRAPARWDQCSQLFICKWLYNSD